LYAFVIDRPDPRERLVVERPHRSSAGLAHNRSIAARTLMAQIQLTSAPEPT
jgi:hypothetical protein